MNHWQRPPAQAFAAVVSHKSNKSQQGNRAFKPNRGRRSAASRPNKYRQAAASIRRQRNNNNKASNKHNGRLQANEVRDMLASRKKRDDDISPKEIDELLANHSNAKDSSSSSKPPPEPPPAVTVHNTVVPIYGTLRVQSKDPDSIRVMSLNVNSLPVCGHNNPKADRLKQVLKDYHIDVAGFQEHCINFKALPSSKTLASVLRYGADDIQSIQAHNTRETKNIGYHQRGGTAVVIREQLTGLVIDRGKDPNDLGMFCFYIVEGRTGTRTIFISAYAPCKTELYGSYYQHIFRYLQENHLPLDPQAFFRNTLVKFILSMVKKKYHIVLMMDSNENVTDGILSKRLAEEDIRMRESVHRAMPGRRGPNTFFRNKSGSAIDGIWISDDIELVAASYLPYDGTIGDHRPVVIDIHMRSVLGTLLQRVQRPKARRLTSAVPRIRNEYLSSVRDGFKERKIEQMIVDLERDATFPPSEDVSMRMEKLDNILEDILLQSERGCRKIYTAHFEFSPEVQLWIDKCHLLKWILDSHRGKNVKRKNMRRFAKKLHMFYCIHLPVTELVELFIATKAKTKEYMATSPFLRKQYLHQRLHDAIENGKDEEAKRIQATLQAEEQRKIWRNIKLTTKGHSQLSVVRVEVPQEDGTVIECSTKESVEAALMEELSTRFGRAESAPICQGVLFDLLGTYANTDAAIEILEGTFTPPTGTDPATKLLLEEIARIWEKIGDGEVSVAVSREDFQYYWKRVKEKISSSFSGLHFGHYKSIAHDDYLSDLMARKLSLIAETGAAPERWARGLSVMLEKIAGVALVTKLRAILLLEADFNFHNKLIFGSRMLNLAREHGLVPDEIYSEKGRTSEDAILQQVLLYDIARITKRPLVVAQVDAAQCYDRVALSMAALTARAFKVHNSSVMGMLRPLHCMEFFLRTGFGQSETYFGGKENGKQGLAQGNGAAPPMWQQIQTLNSNAQHRLGHGIEIICPISLKRRRQVGVAYVDDTNLWGGLGEDDDVYEAAHKSQQGITSWNSLLNASGGMLRPEKCSATIHHMVPDGKGDWVYADQLKKKDEDELDELDDIQFQVKGENGDLECIKRLATNQAVENLGMLARPDGNPEQHFACMKEKMTNWTAKIKNGSIPTRSVWMSYTHQLWAGLRYGLSASSASLLQLQKGLGSADYQLLSNLGVVRSITKEWRYLPATFGGMELFELPIEATAATVSAFLQHYSTGSPVDTALTAVMQYIQLEIGVDKCPFQYDFTVWGHLATNSWGKALWEKIDHYGLSLEIDYPSIPTPRENDCLLMQMFVDKGIRGAELKSLNRVRIAQEALFLSDITTCNGRYLENSLIDTIWRETEEADLGRHRSKFGFWTELPTQKDLKVWEKHLRRLTSTSTNLHLSQPLGRWIGPSPRIWRYMYDEEDNVLEIHHDDRIEVYEHDVDSLDHTNVMSHICTNEVSDGRQNTKPVEIEFLSDNRIKVLRSQGPRLWQEPPPPDDNISFRERLRKKGGEWMWETLRFKEGEDAEWIVEAIQRDSLYIVTDGSHLADLAPEISGAAFIFYCIETHNWLKGEFAEESESADSYRAEQLGMLAIHLILLTLEEQYENMEAATKLFCDNKGTITTFSKRFTRVPTNSKNADVLRVLRKIQSVSRLHHRLEHVKGHQDDIRSWNLLSTQAKMNVECDGRAKEAVIAAAANKVARRRQIYKLPMEAAALYIEGEKQTADTAKALRYYIGKAQARKFYADEGIMDAAIFDSVAWEDLRGLLSRRPKMFQLWLSKQSSGFCGTGARLKIWDATESGKCPNCGCLETADHLNRCKSKVRRELFTDNVYDLVHWLEDNCTHPEILRWLPLYINSQDRHRFVDLKSRTGAKMSQPMRRVGNSLDRIGWRQVTEGKLSMELRAFQRKYLQQQNSQLSIEQWMRGLIDKILTLTHTQWLCRNLTKHHKTKGAKALATKAEIRQEIERQLGLGADGLPEYSKCLLEISPEQLFAMNTSSQQHWLNACEAARKAAAGEADTSDGAQETNEARATFVENLAPVFRRSQPPRERQVRQAPPVPPNPTRQVRVDMLRRNTDEERQECNVTEILRQRNSANWKLEYTNSDSVDVKSIKRANPGIWLNDALISAFLLRVLKKAVNDPHAHYFNTFFMSQLLSTGNNGTDPPRYNFGNVRSWTRHIRRQGGLLGMRDVFVPINHTNSHWLFIHVEVNEHKITIRDSMGRQAYHDTYMTAMLDYMGDLYQEFKNEDPTDWKAMWTCSYVHSPQQTNGYDCGVFTLVNIALLAQRVELDEHTYSNSDINSWDTRQRIVYLLWKASRNKPLPRSQRPSNPTSRRSSTAISSKRPASKRTRPSTTRSSAAASASVSSSKARQKRRRTNRNDRIVLGSSRPHGIISSKDKTPSEQLSQIINRKRSAVSVAEGEASVEQTTQRHAPPKKRKRNNIARL